MEERLLIGFLAHIVEFKKVPNIILGQDANQSRPPPPLVKINFSAISILPGLDGHRKNK